jgi:cytidyltransferase-like protein
MKANKQKRVAFAIMRTQPLHFGHTRIIERMISKCETAIVALGSADKSRVPANPFTIEERIQMLDNVFGNRIKIVPLRDLGATAETSTWCDYALDKISKLGMPAPTDYFTGSRADAIWYRQRFFNADIGSPTDLTQEEFLQHYMPNGVFRMLHVENRNGNYTPSATELRTYLQTRSDGWKEWTPEVNHDLIEENYPEEFKVGHI